LLAPIIPVDALSGAAPAMIGAAHGFCAAEGLC
jgi:hypothetical protein